MTKWHRTRRGDLGLRALGLGILALSYASINHLMYLHGSDPAHWTPDVFAYVLTATGFLSGSAGLALTLLGAHLFDEVQVSERWRVKPPTDRGTKAGSIHTWSVTDATSAGETSPFVPSRTERVSTPHGTDPLPRQARASMAPFRRVEDRGGLVLAMMMPMAGQSRR